MIRLLALCLLLVPQLSVAAGAAGVSRWTITRNTITLRYTFPEGLATRLAPPRSPAPPVETIAAYVLSRASVRQQDTPCPAVDQGYDLGNVDTLYAGPGLKSFEILFRCPRDTGALVLRNAAFFELAAAQIGIADLRLNGGAVVTRVLTAGDTAVRIDAGGTPAPSGAATYCWLGTRHALGTLLCLCTALGLVLLARVPRRLALVAGGLCGGYLLAGLAAGIGGLLLQPQAAQVSAGVLLALIAAQLVARNTARPAIVAAGLVAAVAIATAAAVLLHQGNAALALVGIGVFGVVVITLPGHRTTRDAALLIQAALAGLIDGFALATRFAPLRMVHALHTGQLLAYDTGALLGVLLMSGMVIAVRDLLQRHAPQKHAGLCRDLLAALLAGVGAYSMLTL